MSWDWIWWSPHLFSSLSARLLPNSLLNWAPEPLSHTPIWWKVWEHLSVPLHSVLWFFLLLNGVLPFRNPNWILGDEMIPLAPTTSRFLQTILWLPNEHSSPGAKEKSVPGLSNLKKKKTAICCKLKRKSGGWTLVRASSTRNSSQWEVRSIGSQQILHKYVVCVLLLSTFFLLLHYPGSESSGPKIQCPDCSLDQLNLLSLGRFCFLFLL